MANIFDCENQEIKIGKTRTTIRIGRTGISTLLRTITI